MSLKRNDNGDGGSSIDISTLSKEAKQDDLLTEVIELKNSQITTNNLMEYPVFTPFFSKVTEKGEIMDVSQVSFTNTGTVDGYVLDTVLQPNETVSFGVDHLKGILSSISFDSSNTEFTIVSLKLLV